MKILGSILVIAGILFALPAQSQKPAVEVGTLTPYKVYQGEAQKDGKYKNARICLVYGKDENCFSDGWDEAYSEIKAEPVTLKSGRHLILVSALSMGASDGSLGLYLIDERNRQPVNILLNGEVSSNDGFWEKWQLNNISPLPVLMTADKYWGNKEIRSSPHTQTIRAYVYNPDSGLYEQSFEYRTVQKYSNNKNVLVVEKSRILSRLASAADRPAAAPASAQSNKTSAGKVPAKPVRGPHDYGLMDSDTINSYTLKTGYTSLQMDLLTLSMMPELLKQKSVMQSFISLNNCRYNPQVLGEVKNEFEYAALSDFYQQRAPQILQTIAEDAPLHQFSLLFQIELGDYDFSRHVFPISSPSDGFVMDQYHRLYGEDIPGKSHLHCTDGISDYSEYIDSLSEYGFKFDPINIKELPLSLEDARKYVESLSANRDNRYVQLQLDFEVTNERPMISASGREILFHTRIKRMRIIIDPSMKSLSNLSSEKESLFAEKYTAAIAYDLTKVRMLTELPVPAHYTPEEGAFSLEHTFNIPGPDRFYVAANAHAYPLEHAHFKNVRSADGSELSVETPGETSPVPLTKDLCPQGYPVFMVHLKDGLSTNAIQMLQLTQFEGKRRFVVRQKDGKNVLKAGTGHLIAQKTTNQWAPGVYAVVFPGLSSAGEYCLSVNGDGDEDSGYCFSYPGSDALK